MDGGPILARLAEALERHGVDAVLIGNAAAALHGAPVTTLDFDFMFRNTAANRKKLSVMADKLGATLYRPYRADPGTLKLQDNDYRLLVNFLGDVAGVRSFEGLRKRAKRVRAGKAVLLVENLGDMKSREQTMGKRRVTRKEKLELIRKANERAQRDLIRGLLAIPMERRTHFLRRLVGPGGASCL